ncbi:hypothetical protein QBC34DRAFT_380679 [Podospora aff. communis PSN243]|uniref:F-box domain-containing protein n=1 Tax=Podospora aff. communis PSN243 TaxID=3040156 RepID=A0AAV9GLL6_9PEZI|nr:hypothetical protein QBC34DRAFT_380679 [Podospora aff. communis PSN243]
MNQHQNYSLIQIEMPGAVMSLDRLPVEILTQISHNVFEKGNGRTSLVNLGRSCKLFHEIAQPIIYRQIHFTKVKWVAGKKPPTTIFDLIDTLDSNADLAALVKAISFDAWAVHDIYWLDEDDPRLARFVRQATRILACEPQALREAMLHSNWEHRALAVATLFSLTPNVTSAAVPVLQSTLDEPEDEQDETTVAWTAPINLSHIIDLRLVGIGLSREEIAESYHILPIVQAVRNTKRLTLDDVWFPELVDTSITASITALSIIVNPRTADAKSSEVANFLRGCRQLEELLVEQVDTDEALDLAPFTKILPWMEAISGRLKKLRLEVREDFSQNLCWWDPSFEPAGPLLETTCRLPELKHLSVDACLCKDLQAERSLEVLIENCSALQVLELKDIWISGDPATGISKQAIAHFSSCVLRGQFASLRELRLYSQAHRRAWVDLMRIRDKYTAAFTSVNARFVARLSRLKGGRYSGPEWDEAFSSFDGVKKFMLDEGYTWLGGGSDHDYDANGRPKHRYSWDLSETKTSDKEGPSANF